jgi:neutral ceramidase
VDGWRVDSDSPLLSLPSAGRARFVLAAPAVPELPQVAGLLAGAAEVDVTPPPGLPMAGYSRRGRTGTGLRTRLRCRVLHLRAGHASVALVHTDLLAGSPVVARLVALDIAEDTDVPLAGLLLGATHSHGGPGGYLGSDVYNRFAAARGGFDPVWTQTLASRIAGAVREAVAARRPAVLAWGAADVPGLTRNRAPDAQAANRGPAAPPRPTLHLLRVDAAGPGGSPIGASLVFPVHGTAVGRAAGEYHADLWHHVVAELGRRIAAAGGDRPVIGALQGAAGDISPALGPRGAGHPEAQRIGTDLGSAAYELYRSLEGRLDGAPPLAAGLREVGVTGSGLARRPALGTALLAGTSPDPPLTGRLPLVRAGSPRRRPRGAQGVKRVLFGRLPQALFLPADGFPLVFPVHCLLIGDTWLAAVPAELTAESGRRLAERVARAAGGGGPPPSVVTTSVAGDYAGYCTTEEEYGRQCYEGAHTLYGPGTAGFLAGAAADLAAELGAGPARRGGLRQDAGDRDFDLRMRTPEPARPRSRPLDGHPARRVCEQPRWRAGTQCWEMTWDDDGERPLSWHDPLVRVEAAGAAGAAGAWLAAGAAGMPEDDSGAQLAITHDAPGGGYRVRWFAAPDGGRFRFVLLPNGGRGPLPSEPFG